MHSDPSKALAGDIISNEWGFTKFHPRPTVLTPPPLLSSCCFLVVVTKVRYFLGWPFFFERNYFSCHPRPAALTPPATIIILPLLSSSGSLVVARKVRFLQECLKVYRVLQAIF